MGEESDLVVRFDIPNIQGVNPALSLQSQETACREMQNGH